MSSFVVVTFPNAEVLHHAMGQLDKLHANGSIKLYSATVLTRDTGGGLSIQKLIEEGRHTTAVGALIGGLAGSPLGPVAAIIGAAGGALIGESAEIINQDDEIKLVESISRKIAPGTAVIVAELEEGAMIAFGAAMKRSGGMIIPK